MEEPGRSLQGAGSRGLDLSWRFLSGDTKTSVVDTDLIDSFLGGLVGTLDNV